MLIVLGETTAMRVVGIKHYDAQKARATGVLREGALVSIAHEPGNRHDRNAHAVHCGPYKLGHVPRFAAQLLGIARRRSPISCVVTAVLDSADGLEIRLRVDSGIRSAPGPYALEAVASSQSGVYAIVNVVDMRAYIGQGQSMEQRRQSHLSLLRRGTHFSSRLQGDWRQWPQRFALVVLKQAAQSKLNYEEMRAIRLYGTNDLALGYNQGGGFAPSNDSPNRRRGVSETSGQLFGSEGDDDVGRRQNGPGLRPQQDGKGARVGVAPAARTNRPASPQKVGPRAASGGCMVVLVIATLIWLAAALSL